MSKQVIVFGGSGFLGSHVVEELVGRGYRVTVFDKKRLPLPNCDHNMVLGDVLDSDLVKSSIKGQDAVFHFAGLSDLDLGLAQPLEAVQQNIAGTVHLLDGALEANLKRFVFASSIYVYSNLGGFYRCSKQAAELFIEEFNSCYGVDFTILRYGSLYGTRANNSNGIRRFLLQGLSEGKIDYPGTGDEVREYIHVKDAARLTVDILSPEYKNKHIVITGHHPMKTREMMEMIREILNKDIKLKFSDVHNNFHYTLTPYSYTPKVGSKLVSNCYVDMGQGLLECLQEISRDLEKD
ncbi:MAG TPA: NAD(P)-dependent oxidoreductase [Nitrospinaceae bacterium]|nr:NAD(P)-dependent oxidoreductase [Nitrospinaceae bacterium]